MYSWVCPQWGPYDVVKLLGVHASESPAARTSGGCDLDCGAETESSDVSSRHLKFSLRLQQLKSFSSGSGRIWSIENWKPLYYLYNLLGHKLELWNGNQYFRLRLRLHHLRILGSGFSHINLLGLRLHSPSCDQTWRERGRSGHAAFGILKRFWQIRVLENKVLWPIYAVLSENFCAYKIMLLKFILIFEDDQETFFCFFHFLSLVTKFWMYYRNLECRNTTVWMFNRDRNFKVGML